MRRASISGKDGIGVPHPLKSKSPLVYARSNPAWETILIGWQSIDTVLLDMDGTLLDLRYDNVLWNQLRAGFDLVC